MTVLLCIVLCCALMCTALAIVSPLPLSRTIDEVAVVLEESNPYHPGLYSVVYATTRGEKQVGARSFHQHEGVAAKHYVRVRRMTILIIIDWVCSFMTIISVSFLIYDVAAHGLFFIGSVLPLVLTIAFPLLNSLRRSIGRFI
jgi:hypothetical protein